MGRLSWRRRRPNRGGWTPTLIISLIIAVGTLIMALSQLVEVLPLGA